MTIAYYILQIVCGEVVPLSCEIDREVGHVDGRLWYWVVEDAVARGYGDLDREVLARPSSRSGREGSCESGWFQVDHLCLSMEVMYSSFGSYEVRGIDVRSFVVMMDSY